MTKDELIGLFAGSKQIGILKEQLKPDASKVRLRGVAGSANSFIASEVIKSTADHHLFVLTDKETAAYFLSDLELLMGKKKVLFYPMSYRRAYELEETDNSNVIQRGEVLNALQASTSQQIIVTYSQALAEKVISKKTLRKNTFTVGVGEDLDLDFINEMLHEYHFERVDQVYEPGQFAIRGGIIDVFSFAQELPYRIELFGDEVDSIRAFDPAEQLSVKSLRKATIVPNVQDEVLLQEKVPFFDFLSGKTTVWVEDVEELKLRVDKELDDAKLAFAQLGNTVGRAAPAEKYVSSDEILTSLEEKRTVEFGVRTYFRNAEEVQFDTAPQPVVNKDFNLLQKILIDNKNAGYQNVLLVDNPGQVERLHSIFDDLPLPDGTRVEKPFFTSMVMSIHEGFVNHELKLACFTDHQIFERYHRYRMREGYKRGKQALTLKEISGLNPGDYVTHIDHGVGKFAGLEKIDVNGKPQETIRLVYRDNDILYVSIHSLHRISKYSSKEGEEPKINKLGSPAWKNLKAKTKRQVKDIAKDLIKLYAKRRAQKGFAFAPDTYLQTELEASFIYEDTPDQEKATEAFKADMEKDYPMDRLICGDVGFGKTEVAIRAAFKAVADGKQVAVLVPTTILALQHARTFRSRLKEFPCTVDYINRFKTRKQQTETLKKVADGQIDILIGTHRIVGKDVKFKDLGLLIIDEEQKFGVAVKDKLKKMKVNVDTLTLTATPIPRTLQFSLMGARDLSVINTPPPNRYPVITELHTFNEELIRDAIMYEVGRGGQVFFVNNRVENIQQVAGMISRLCPDVHVCVGHGQMEPSKLEDTMMRFMEGEYDVLVATTIIESGLDISNANTIIINNANHFGLSDLHQMRGRVGRSNKKAFCYLLAPPVTMLTPEARKRLKAIEEFSDLGSGFNIAMRDLDIRGAGNLLGAEQSGFISDIGIEMYHKILDEAVNELKETEFKELFKDEPAKPFVEDCQIDTDLEILLPDQYVNAIAERLALYRELDDLENAKQLAEFERRLIDRFGPIPAQGIQLLETIRLRWIAKALGFEKLILKHNTLVGYFVSDPESGYYQGEGFALILNFIKSNPQKAIMRQKNDKLTLRFEKVSTITEAISLLADISPDLTRSLLHVPERENVE
ncbi:MAG: transcription-repair coupling factor [Flavobacteriales bacterium]|nr:transcription-repair coupling factor [Flavobacteriales bacterium]